MEKIKKHCAGLLFIAVYFFLTAYKLIIHVTPFYDWDESIYAQVGREMIRQKSYLVPLWQGTPWLDKPPIPSLFYGIVELFPISAEISTRIATLILGCIALFLLYKFIYRITASRVVSFATIVITAFLPLFVQRSQALNVDVFLLIGWLGYTLYEKEMIVSSLFLLLAVLSKSLLGFYAPGMFVLFYSYQLVRKEIGYNMWWKKMQRIALQILFVSLWFVGMTIVYGHTFIQLQFIESHFKRVAASIEQHFGQRTFYIDILVDQMKTLIVPAVISTMYLIFLFFKKKKNNIAFLSLFFIPWFLFLNITKTKIAWYLYPILPQFAFLSAYPLLFFKKNVGLTLIYMGIIFYILFSTISPLSTFMGSTYATFDDHYYIALDAHGNRCKSLSVLVGGDTRSSYAVLHKMDLTITTTTWWGNHPSIAYYADTKTVYDYTLTAFQDHLNQGKPEDCFIFEKTDEKSLSIPPTSQGMKISNKTYSLIQIKK